MYELIETLYPICRSITGDGVRYTLTLLGNYIPLEVREVPTGTAVFDWTIPDEWNIRDAWIRDRSGRTVVDFHNCNLHVVSYSEPVRRTVSIEELQDHLHSLPDRPNWIPYRTSYYSRTWGFCLTDNQRQGLQDREYDVCIDSTLAPGSLTYGELRLPGEHQDEFLVSSHICHPSLCNDNLTGVALCVFLARYLSERKHRWSYRFLFAPGTIGAITWLARNHDVISRIRGGLTLVCLGDSERLTYQRSLPGNSEIDRAVTIALRDSGEPHHIIDYCPGGYDERQYNSPGFRIPVGSLMRGRNGDFPEYHTSADNLSFVRQDQLLGSLACLKRIVDVLESDTCYTSLCPFGEPQLSKRGLSQQLDSADRRLRESVSWVLSLSDGTQTLLDIAQRSGLPFDLVRQAADILHENGIVQPRVAMCSNAVRQS